MWRVIGRIPPDSNPINCLAYQGNPMTRTTWQPIEKAPKDGTEQILWQSGWGKMIGYWSDGLGRWYIDGSEGPHLPTHFFTPPADPVAEPTTTAAPPPSSIEAETQRRKDAEARLCSAAKLIDQIVAGETLAWLACGEWKRKNDHYLIEAREEAVAATTRNKPKQ
jgi:hypothetical protein